MYVFVLVHLFVLFAYFCLLSLLHRTVILRSLHQLQLFEFPIHSLTHSHTAIKLTQDKQEKIREKKSLNTANWRIG